MSESTAGEKIFRYVPWTDLAEAVRNGWIPHRSLDGTHHGCWSVLCEQDTVPEEWRDIPGYEGEYQVSSYGNVRSLDRILTSRMPSRGYPRLAKGRLLKPQALSPHGYGYLYVGLRHNRNKHVSNLVALAFIGPKPNKSMEVAHNDGLPVNNRAQNLRYATASENANDKMIHGTWGIGEKCPNSILTDEQVRIIRKLLVEQSVSEVAKQFEVGIGAISLIAQGRRWTHVEPLPGEIGTPEADARRRKSVDTRRRENIISLNKNHPNSHPTSRSSGRAKCESCGNSFWRKRRGHNFCSTACANRRHIYFEAQAGAAS